MLAQGRKSEAGTIARVSAPEIEAVVVDALRAAYIAAGSVDAGSKPEPYGIIASKSDDRDARCSGLGNQRRYRPAGRHDDINAAADELGGEWRQPIIEAVCPHIINHDVLAFDKPELFETAAECRQENRGGRSGRAGSKKTDHGRLLRLCPSLR